MILYKNVDISDLASIIDRGILSMDDCGNNNWDDGRRANNATDCVYLFKPIQGGENYFPQYGVVRLTVDVDDPKLNEMSETDANRNLYEEYIINRVSPDRIVAIDVANIFWYNASFVREYDVLPEDIKSKVNLMWAYVEINGKRFSSYSSNVPKVYGKLCDIETLSAEILKEDLSIETISPTWWRIYK